MEELKRSYRELEQDTEGGIRPAEGGELDPKDASGSIGDATGRDLGNLGDDVRDEGDRTFPDTEPSDKSM